MCRTTTCDQCGKTTWAGCGQHVDEVMKGVPTSERCTGHEPAEATKPSFFARLRGR